MEKLIEELHNDFEVVDNFYGFVIVFGFKHKDLKEYTIPDGVNIIGDNCFCDSNIEKINFSDSITIIGKRAFYNCANLKSIELPDKIQILENEAFYNCKNIESIRLSNDLIKLGNGAFLGCRHIKNIIIPGKVELIGFNSFSNLEDIEYIKLEEGIKSLGNGKFIDIKNDIKALYLPKSIKRIDKAFVFINDSIIENIYYNGTIDDKNNIEINDDLVLNAKWHYGK